MLSCVALCFHVVVFCFFFSPFSIVITSLGEERAGMCAYFACVDFSLSSPSICVEGWLRLVTVALHGLFYYYFIIIIIIIRIIILLTSYSVTTVARYVLDP